MARCDEGYICAICGADVELVTDSDLYLRFILGEVLLEVLHLEPERHVRCNPYLAQFIVDDHFPPVECEGAFGKHHLDAEHVADEERRVTRGWRRLRAVPTLGLSVAEYPLHVTPDDSDTHAP